MARKKAGRQKATPGPQAPAPETLGQATEAAAQPAGHLSGNLLLAAGLVLVVLAIYGRTIGFGYVSYDDNLYVYENEQVQEGLSARNAAWAFTTFHASNWHPLTWLSLELDATLLGGSPAARHLVNAGLHAANVVIFFALLLGLSGSAWAAALAAALFAVHPCHVESVAWVTERKDVLSTLFWLLSIRAYVGWVKQGGVLRYAASLGCMALGLLAKPMLVTLPFVLLLLDVWPLRRFEPWPGGQGGRAFRRPIVEKIPFLALALASVAVTIVAQHLSQSVVPLGHFPLGLRLANALTSYAAYLGKLALPMDLAVWYPYPKAVPVWKWAGSLVLLGLVSAAAYWRRREQPCLAVGWLWFLGTLVPVIGLLQVGGQSMADRYTYVPYLGLYLALGLGLTRFVERRPDLSRIAAAAAGIVLVALGLTAFRQAGFWQDNTALYGHALAVTRDNYVAHNNLGNEFRRQLRFEEALAHYFEAAKIRPGDVEPRVNMAMAYMQLGRADLAEESARAALAVDPNSADAHAGIGLVLLEAGWPFSAEEHLKRALELNPGLLVVRRHMEEVEARKRSFRSYNPELRFELLPLVPASDAADAKTGRQTSK